MTRGEKIADKIIQVFDSQISGGKRYDEAVIGRRRANATFCKSHNYDTARSVIFGIDIMPLIEDKNLDIGSFAQRFVQDLSRSISSAICKMANISG